MHFLPCTKPEVRSRVNPHPFSTTFVYATANTEVRIRNQQTKIDGSSQSWAEPFSHLVYPASACNPRQPVFYQHNSSLPHPSHHGNRHARFRQGKGKKFDRHLRFKLINSGPLPELNWLCPLWHSVSFEIYIFSSRPNIENLQHSTHWDHKSAVASDHCSLRKHKHHLY